MKILPSDSVWMPEDEDLQEFAVILPAGARPPTTTDDLAELTARMLDRMVEGARAGGSLADCEADLQDVHETIQISTNRKMLTWENARFPNHLMDLSYTLGGAGPLGAWREAAVGAVRGPSRVLPMTPELQDEWEAKSLADWMQANLM